jgi:hypothetical protein
MRPRIDKLKRVLAEMVAERGPVKLFALVLREDAMDRWDLLISAPWADAASREAYDYVASKLKAILDPAEMLSISHFAFPDADSEWMQVLTHSFPADGAGLIHVRQLNVGATTLRDVYLFAAPATAQPTMANS